MNRLNDMAVMRAVRARCTDARVRGFKPRQLHLPERYAAAQRGAAERRRASDTRGPSSAAQVRATWHSSHMS